jgi:hypothetical protein
MPSDPKYENKDEKPIAMRIEMGAQTVPEKSVENNADSARNGSFSLDKNTMLKIMINKSKEQNQ